MQGHVAKPVDPRTLFVAIAEHARPAQERAVAA
jgi:hypothetical protein